MKVVYVAGPFTAENAWEIEQNVRRAEEAGLEVAKLGASPVIPHANTRFFHGTMTPEFWYRATEALMFVCHAVLLIPGWTASKGAVAERDRAVAAGIPVFNSLGALADWLREDTVRAQERRLAEARRHCPRCGFIGTEHAGDCPPDA